LPAPSGTFLFETTVLSAFALVGRLDLLEARYSSRACWVDAVHAEVLAGIGEHPSLGDVLVSAWLGPPIEVFAVAEIERVRQRLGAGRHNRRHLGEAASIVVARREGWTLACDDFDAGRVARDEGLPVVTTPMILRALVRHGQLTAGEASGLLLHLVEGQGRRLPVPDEAWFQ